MSDPRVRTAAGGTKHAVTTVVLEVAPSPAKVSRAGEDGQDGHFPAPGAAETMPATSRADKCGNSVCPPLSEALVRANMADEIALTEAQAA